MDTATLDRFIKLLGRSGTRRSALGVLLGTAVMGNALGSAAAKGKRNGKGKLRAKRSGKSDRSVSGQAKPGREVSDLTDDFTNTTCGFPVEIHQEGKVIALDFGDRLLFAVPGATWELTNPASGAAIRVVVPGPEFVEFNEDGSVTVKGTGPWAWGRRHPVTREDGIWLTRGRFVWLFDADGNLTSAEFNGNSQNLCHVLA